MNLDKIGKFGNSENGSGKVRFALEHPNQARRAALVNHSVGKVDNLTTKIETQTRSTIIAIPCPPPMQAVASP